MALAQHRQLQDWLNSFAEILLAFWLLTAFWMGIKLIFSARFREELFARIFKTGHQDEREAFVSAHSAHKAHLFTMAILCILLFFSVSTLTISNPLVEQRAQGQKGEISFGLHFDLGEFQNILRGKFAFQYPQRFGLRESQENRAAPLFPLFVAK